MEPSLAMKPGPSHPEPQFSYLQSRGTNPILTKSVPGTKSGSSRPPTPRVSCSLGLNSSKPRDRSHRLRQQRKASGTRDRSRRCQAQSPHLWLPQWRG